MWKLLAWPTLGLLMLNNYVALRGIKADSISLSCTDMTLSTSNNITTLACTDNSSARQDAAPTWTDVNIGVDTKSLKISALSSSIINSLLIKTGGPDDFVTDVPNPAVLTVDENALTGLTALSSMSFMSVNFLEENVTLAIPNSLTFLKIETTNTVDISFTSFEGKKLEKLYLGNNSFSKIPRCLYERKYQANFHVYNFSLKANSEPEKLTTTAYAYLKANINESDTNIECLDDCDDASTQTSKMVIDTTGNNPVSDSSSKYQVCPLTTSTGTSSGSKSDADRSSSTDNTASSSSDDDSSTDTILTVIIVIICLVAAALAYFVFKRFFAKRSSARSGGTDEVAVNLIGKEDTTPATKASFISNDESLRPFRLQQNEVSLIKAVGTGRLWLGEYAGQKVIVKRVEAEVSDSYVTKTLMNQARLFATLSHPNIISLVGVTWLAGTDFGVVAEFMDKNNLRVVLSDLDWELDMSTKISMCLDVAQALAYLHASERNMHVRKLSSRKILVNSTMTCKVNLFQCQSCSSAAIKVDSYGSGDMPWLAPEIILRSPVIDEKKANIYAFGVLMCEVLSRAAPFQTLVEEVGNTLADMEIAKRIRRQETLAPHENRREYMKAPQRMRDMIDLCLSLNPMRRPGADEIVVALQAAQLDEEARSSTDTE